MAYTRSWDEGVPAGTRAANEIDDSIRELKTDLRERLTGVLVDSMAADPIVAHPSVKGNVVGKVLIVGPAAWAEAVGTLIVNSTPTYATVSVPGNAFAHVNLPAGVSIKRIEWHLWSPDANVISLRLWKRQWGLGNAAAQVSALQKNTSGESIIDSGAISHAVASAETYTVEIAKVAGSSFQIWSVGITYDVPDCRNTL